MTLSRNRSVRSRSRAMRNRSRSTKNRTASNRIKSKRRRIQICATPAVCVEALNKGKIIASGGFGKVIAHTNLAIKMIRRANSCNDALKEYEFMKRVWSAFAKIQLHIRDKTVGHKLRKSLMQLSPVEPLHFWDERFQYDNEDFSCGLVTRLVPGMRLEFTYAESYSPPVLVMPLIGAQKTKLSLVNDSLPLSVRNPPRYLTATIMDIKQLYPEFQETQFAYTMGVLLAVMTLVVKIVLSDVEILFGRKSDPHIYIMDFGMCTSFNSKDPFEIGKECAQMGTPFDTKQVFPNEPDSDNFKHFEKGFMDMAGLLKKREFGGRVMEGIRNELRII